MVRESASAPLASARRYEAAPRTAAEHAEVLGRQREFERVAQRAVAAPAFVTQRRFVHEAQPARHGGAPLIGRIAAYAHALRVQRVEGKGRDERGRLGDEPRAFVAGADPVADLHRRNAPLYPM